VRTEEVARATEGVDALLTDAHFPATSAFFADRAAAARDDHVLHYLQLSMPASPLELAAARTKAKLSRAPECFVTIVYRGPWEERGGDGTGEEDGPHVPAELRLTPNHPTPFWHTREATLIVGGSVIVALALAALRSSPAKPSTKQS
jgi:hypothetical protein